MYIYLKYIDGKIHYQELMSQLLNLKRNLVMLLSSAGTYHTGL